MGYTARAYVKPKDFHAKNEVIRQLNEMGYRCSFGGIWASDNVLMIDQGVYWGVHVKPLGKDEFIDCDNYTPNGTEEETVKLFLELAHMDSSKNWGQLIRGDVDGKVMRYYYSLPLFDKVNNNWERLSPLEVAEAFREGRI